MAGGVSGQEDESSIGVKTSASQVSNIEDKFDSFLDRNSGLLMGTAAIIGVGLIWLAWSGVLK